MLNNDLIPALLTPCSGLGKIDFTSLRSLCRFLFDEGVTGLFAVSSTGEMPLLGDAERRAILETVREETSSRHTLYAGVSTTGVSDVKHSIRESAAAGADVAVVMAPFFLKLDQDQLVHYAFHLADESPIPLALYHHLRMPTEIAGETVARLAEHPNIVAFKETSGDSLRMKKIVEQKEREDFRVFQGSEALVLDSLRQGANGCVTALSNLAPGLHRELFRAFEAGAVEEADRLQTRLTALWKIFQLPSVSKSFAHFVQTLKIPLTEAGILTDASTMIFQNASDSEFQREVLSFYRSWLAETPNCISSPTR